VSNDRQRRDRTAFSQLSGACKKKTALRMVRSAVDHRSS